MLPSDHAPAKRLMTSTDVSRLPLRKIEAALRKTTEALATELAAPTERAPDWTEFEWCIARAVAAIHGVSPLLATTLRWRGPESWESFLGEQRNHTFQRHQRIAQLLDDIGAHAVHRGIAIVPLKGAALHEMGIYQPGERPMSDIDLLVRSADVQEAMRLLRDCGYHEIYKTWKHWVFEPERATSSVGFGEHTYNSIKIELHARVAERLPLVDREISSLVFPTEPRAGLNGYPSIPSLITHLLLHAAGNMCFNSVRLLHLHDIARLSHLMTVADWEGAFSEGHLPPWWTAPPLALTARYYQRAIPAHIVARAESNCSWLLRRNCRRQTLSDVSLSNLWIQAFPGVEWSHSTREILGYVTSRVMPDREASILYGELARRHPSSTSFSWPHLPRWQRIVRWLFSRRPRVETLSSVGAALSPLSSWSQFT